MKTTEKNISQILKTFRSENALTQKQASEALDISTRAYTYYETGEREPSGVKYANILRKIATYNKQKNGMVAYELPLDTPQQASEPAAIYRENELLRDIIKAKDELIAILREQLNNPKS